jgi:solute carrier family 25 uncoupling protein 8/9
MQAEGKLPPEVPRRYKNTLHAFVTIFKNEGLAGLYKGVGPTTYRATLLYGILAHILLINF